jgi:hypothetical protein
MPARAPVRKCNLPPYKGLGNGLSRGHTAVRRKADQQGASADAANIRASLISCNGYVMLADRQPLTVAFRLQADESESPTV